MSRSRPAWKRAVLVFLDAAIVVALTVALVLAVSAVAPRKLEPQPTHTTPTMEASHATV